jgi:hypothetical protein
MKLTNLIAASIALAVLFLVTSPAAAAEEGVAVAIVYDTSGSMKEPVKDEAGKFSPKYRIANRALMAIADQIEIFAANGVAGKPRKIQSGLFVFQKDRPHAAIPFGPFDAAALTTWARGFTSPNGGTPLGNTLDTAGHAVLKSDLQRKHVLVITDGMNTVGPNPAAILARLQREAGQTQTSLSVHFVAFDVDAKVFDGVKKLGATVVAASNESQLNTQLEFILEKKILLEEEEPAKKK